MKTSTIISLIVVIALIGIAAYLIIRPSSPLPPPDDTSLSGNKIYTNSAMGFSVRVPEDYAIDENYAYEALGPESAIHGVKFTIPAALTDGTNLASDSSVSVEEVPGAPSCTADIFLPQGTTAHAETDAGVVYSVATSSDAGAGNRYEESVYALSGTNPCLAVRYFIHYGAIENYPAGQVKEFDKAALVASFDQIRRSLALSR